MTNKNLARVLVLTPHDIDASESPSVTMPFRLFGIDIVTDLDDEGTENEGDIEFTSYAADKSLVVKAENENGEAAVNPRTGSYPCAVAVVRNDFRRGEFRNDCS